MLNLSDLKYFYVILSDDKTNTTEKLKILRKLEVWSPIKDYVVISNIGKVLYKCSKLPGELGIKSSSIVNNWKRLIIDNNNQNSNISINVNESIKGKNASRKSQISLPEKKVCLSLQDYYKRKGIDKAEKSDPYNLPDNLSTSDENSDELTSALGISFMDSFSIKPANPVKSKPAKPLKISEIAALTSAASISQRNDIVATAPREPDLARLEDTDLTRRVHVSLKCWVPKVQKPQFVCRSGYTQPQSLLKLCQDVLLIYRACIEEVYLTPRDLLATVLDNYNADQLMNFESFNPHYIADNDDLWHKQFLARFPHEQRRGNETWRQAFLHAEKRESEKLEMSVRNMKRKYESDVKSNNESKIKLIAASRRCPVAKRFFQPSDSPYSRVTQQLQRQYKKQFSHLPF